MADIGSINFGGLASGLDTKTIIEELMAVDSKPLKRLEDNQTNLTNKKDAYTSMKSDLLTLKNSVSDLRNSSAFGVFSASSSDEEALTLSALPSAREGTYRIKILSLAQAKALSSNSYTATNTPLGLSGEITLNGKGFRIRSSDTLQDIANGINSLDNGVNATILKVAENDNRIILSSSTQGKQGFLLANAGASDILGALGFTDGTTVIRETLNGKVLSQGFSSATSTIGSIAGISSQAKGTVNIRGNAVSIDLASDTLSSIRDKINALGIKGVTAAVESSTENGATVYRLTISGTQDFTDDGNVLETLGILTGGTSGVKARFQTTSLSPNETGASSISQKTRFTDIGSIVSNGKVETITITGTNTDGSAVSRTLQIGKNTTIGDLLKEIETTFSGNVQASVDDGKITIESTTGGESQLSVQIMANNENGGSLDFGTVSAVTPGRQRLVSEGVDATLLVNNTTLTRSTNEISDALTGVSLSLKKADPTSEVVVTVTRDTAALKTKIEAFVKAYNDVVDFVDKNAQFDQEKKTAGPLMGDTTSRTVINRLRNTIQQSYGGDGFDYTQLFQVGIEFDSTGHLNIKGDKLDETLKTDLDAVIRLFTVTRSSSDGDINFTYSSVKTKTGTYEVIVSQAADKAVVQSDPLAGGTATQSGTITIVDNLGSKVSVDVAEGDKALDIANRVNGEAAKTYEQIIGSDKTLKRSDGSAIAQNTSIGDIAGVQVSDGDTITVTGTDHNGRSYQRRLVLSSSGGTTVQDILTAIERINDNNVSASIDADGRISVQDKTSGTSKLNVSISSTVKGLDSVGFSIIQNGRNTVSIGASVSSDNRLVITHNAYGSGNTFTVSGGGVAGIADGTYSGKDVTGTINGVAGVGSGQSLAASNSDASSQGITVQVTITPEELAKEGKFHGTITLLSGAADALYRETSAFTDTVGGFVQAKIDSFNRSLVTATNNITEMNKRLDLRKQTYVKKFAALEKSLSLLQSTQQQLSATLSALPQAKL